MKTYYWMWRRLFFMAGVFLLAGAAADDRQVDMNNLSITEPIAGSDIPLHILFVETVDGLYTPIGLRKPPGDGPFPMILLASGNGGGGLKLLRHMSHDMSWTPERLLEAGYAVAWLRYRAEVELGYARQEKLLVGERQGRQLLNRGPLEIDDEIAVIEFVKTLPYIAPDRIGLLGLSHGGEMILKITSQYDGVAAAVASEPAAHEFLALTPDATAILTAGTGMRDLDSMQMRGVEKVRNRINLDLARERINRIKTPILVQGRDRDHLQGIFRLTYELLKESGKETAWISYDHPRHGFIYVMRKAGGNYHPDAVQVRAVNDTIAFFNRYLKP
ncbi:MAG: alpha/beta hydrolase family protein [Gammaproteobacteria bacterium]